MFFVLIVILPLGAAGFVVQRVVVGEIGRRAVSALAPALDATTALYNDRSEALDARVRASLGNARFAELLQRGRSGELEGYLARRVGAESNLDFFVAFDARGRRLAYESVPGQFVTGYDEPGLQEILAVKAGGGAGFIRTPEIPVRVPGKGKVGSVIGGSWIDRDLLLGSSQESVILSLVADGRVIASTTSLNRPLPVALSVRETFDVDIGGSARARARLLDGDMAIVASTPTAPIEALSRRVLTSMAGLLVLALVGTTVLAYLLARLITQPLEELSRRAQAIAEGRFDDHIVTKTHDEVGQLASAFNNMSDRLKDTITQLSSSRNQLQRAVRRVGETLRSTHDMRQMLDSILNTAVDAVGADSGALWRFTPTREDLYVGSAVGLDADSVGRVRVGEGVVGHVAERAATLLLAGEGSGPRPVAAEPAAPVVIAIPLYSQDRVSGVLAVYKENADAPFTREDMDTVIFLAEQGGVAIENVQLHEEAKRLSLMDGLTGTWNRRFFQMQFRQVLATATRFERPFSVLMLDLDYFKQVNDTYGHSRGDAILVEFTQRVSNVLREVDTFARYGGEEFICLLSETDEGGAMTTSQKICDVVRSEPFGAFGEDAISLTVSIGVASYPTHGDTFRGLVDAADRALYRAKEAGRDQVIVAATPTSQLKLAT